MRFDAQLALADMRQPGDTEVWPLPLQPFFGVASARLVRDGEGNMCVEWRDDGFEWDRTGEDPVRSPRQALDRFLTLADGTDDDVLAFVRRFGVLHFALEAAGAWRLDAIERGPRRPTPTAWYRWTASCFRALARLAAEAQRGNGGREEDWLVVGRPEYIPSPLRSADTWRVVTWTLERLLEQAGVRPTLMHGPWPWPFASARQPRLGLTGQTLGGLLVLQLALLVTSADQQPICTVCGVRYEAKRRPAYGRRSYCPKHGKESGWQHARRVSRQKALDTRPSASTPAQSASMNGRGSPGSSALKAST